jgi:hypothetical protein
MISRSPSLRMMASLPGSSNARGVGSAWFRPFLKSFAWRSGLTRASEGIGFGICQMDRSICRVEPIRAGSRPAESNGGRRSRLPRARPMAAPDPPRQRPLGMPPADMRGFLHGRPVLRPASIRAISDPDASVAQNVERRLASRRRCRHRWWQRAALLAFPVVEIISGRSHRTELRSLGGSRSTGAG